MLRAPTDEEMMDTVQQSRESAEAAAGLVQEYEGLVKNTTTADERYTLVQTFVRKRREQQIDGMMAGADATGGAVVSFNFLQGLQAGETSHYLKRMLEWGMMREVHEVVSYQEFAVDKEHSSPSALAAYEEAVERDDYLTPIPGLAYRLMQEAEETCKTYPALSPLYDFAVRNMAKYPFLGDPDYFAPDPYVVQDKLLSEEEKSGISPGEIELALETVDAFGVTFSDIDKEARGYLYHVGVNLTDKEYAHLYQVARTIPVEQRPVFANAFLALEFGQDFGDILLEVGDRLHDRPEELAAVLGSLQAIRENASGIAERFTSDHLVDKQLGQSVNLAFIKRTTEALALIADPSPERQAQGRVVLRLMRYATGIAGRGLAAEFTDNIADSADYETYSSFTEPLAVTIRESGCNARIGLTANLPNDTLPIELRGKKRRLSMRLDYEDGQLSVDLGSTAQHDVHVSPVARFVGLALAEGEELLAHRRALKGIHEGASRQEITLHGNHVREVFPENFIITPQAFQEIARRFAGRLRKRA